MTLEIAEIKRKNPVGQLADTALAHDRGAFAEWWYLVEKKFRTRGIVERLFARAYLAGFADGRVAGHAEGEVTIYLAPPTDERDPRGHYAKRADPADYRPAPTARANERRAS